MSDQKSGDKKDILDWASKDGHFRRQPSAFRDTISRDGRFKPEKGRYPCPWAHRVLIARKLKGLESIIDVTAVHPFMGKLGWSFDGQGYEGQGGDSFSDVKPKEPLYGFSLLRELYFEADKDYDGRFTVPVLWDKKEQTIVNNESSEVLRIFNEEFDDLVDDKFKGLTFYPEPLRKEIDEINSWIYDDLNNGVYKTGFSTKQGPYEESVHKVFNALDRLEKQLEGKDYIVGDRLTEVDIRTYTTIIRFDPVYVNHFKCNIRLIRSGYPNIHRWARQLYWNNDAFSSTTDFDHIKTHYFVSHPNVNPNGRVPVGPVPHIMKL